jgi:ferrous-iron efflux pump FieF
MVLNLDDHKKLLHRATVGAVAVAVTLILIKLYAWHKSGSVALQATLADSVLDALASLINYFAVKHSLKPADHDHRFGHGKIEALAGLGQSVVISISALFIFKEAIERFFKPQPIYHLDISIWVLAISIIATLGLVRYQKYVVSKTNSTAVAADATHYQGDLLINLSVLASLLCFHWFQLSFIDPIIGFSIACYIIWSALQIFQASLDILMDKELSDEIRHSMMFIVRSHPEVKGLHDLRTRSTGITSFFQLHLELEATISLIEAHRIAHEVENLIKKEYPSSEVIIHQDIIRKCES